MQQRIEWNPTRQLWETDQTDLFSEQQEPFSATWPTSGMTRSGRLLPLPMSAHPTAEKESSSLLPTPNAEVQRGSRTPDGIARRIAKGDKQFSLEDAPLNAEVTLLPTPNAQDGNGGKAPRGGSRTHDTGTKRQVPLTDLPDLLPTPVATDRTGGPRTNNRAGRDGDNGHSLKDFAAIHGNSLLPTPAASDSTGGGAHPDRREGHSRQLIDYPTTRRQHRVGQVRAGHPPLGIPDPPRTRADRAEQERKPPPLSRFQ